MVVSQGKRERFITLQFKTIDTLQGFDGLAIVSLLELYADSLPPLMDSHEDLGANAHEWREHGLFRIAPKGQTSLDHVKLKRAYMSLLGAFPLIVEGHDAASPNVHPDWTGILPIDPMREQILALVAAVVDIFSQIRRDRS